MDLLKHSQVLVTNFLALSLTLPMKKVSLRSPWKSLWYTVTSTAKQSLWFKTGSDGESDKACYRCKCLRPAAVCGRGFRGRWPRWPRCSTTWGTGSSWVEMDSSLVPHTPRAPPGPPRQSSRPLRELLPPRLILLGPATILISQCFKWEFCPLSMRGSDNWKSCNFDLRRQNLGGNYFAGYSHLLDFLLVQHFDLRRALLFLLRHWVTLEVVGVVGSWDVHWDISCCRLRIRP